MYHSILDNLKHKNIFVKKSTISCLHKFFDLWGEDMVCDIEESIANIYKQETDMSLKRASLNLLFKLNANYALELL